MAKGKKFGKYTIEAFLIVFSVLLALGLNNAYEAWKLRNQKKTAMEAIQGELHKNEMLVKKILETHQFVLTRIMEMQDNSNDSLQKRLTSSSHFDLWILTGGKSLAPEYAASTAWETARATGIVTEFDYVEVERLTRIYTQQEIIFQGTLSGIIQLLFERETQDKKNFASTMVMLNLRFRELIAQEKTLINYYEQRNKNTLAE